MIEIRKPTARRTSLGYRDRSRLRRIIVIIEPGDLIGFRYERTRQVYRLPIARMMQVAVMAYASAEAKRKAKKAARS